MQLLPCFKHFPQFLRHFALSGQLLRRRFSCPFLLDMTNRSAGNAALFRAVGGADTQKGRGQSRSLFAFSSAVGEVIPPAQGR